MHNFINMRSLYVRLYVYVCTFLYVYHAYIYTRNTPKYKPIFTYM